MSDEPQDDDFLDLDMLYPWQFRPLVGLGRKSALRRVVDVAPGGRNVVSIDELPLVLAGPVLRRVTENEVWVWLATSCSVHVSGYVMTSESDSWLVYRLPDPDITTNNWQDSVGYGEQSSIQYGNRLFITLLKLAPNEDVVAFPTDDVLGYQLFFESIDDRFEITPGCVYHPTEIQLGEHELPTFVIASAGRSASSIRFLHMSCRKPHGEGYDAIHYALERLKDTATDPIDRPAFALLTGDQVYADDVSEYMIARIRRLATLLGGRSEAIPRIATRLSELLGGSESNQRGGLIGDNRMTSDYGDNHVLGFYEFASLYIISWSPAALVYLDRADGRGAQGAPGTIQEFCVQNGFRPDSAFRFLANCPSYMVFDDHEITDDWNITGDVTRAMFGNALARRVVANGLAAFWLFQFKGNVPTNTALDAPIAAYLQKVWTGANVGSAGGRYDRALWNYHGFSFVPPTPVPIVALDTRTRRNPSSRAEIGSELLNAAALAELATTLERVGTSDVPVFIISAAPVLGWVELEEWIQAEATNYLDEEESLTYDQDPEPWSYNNIGLLSFLEVLHASPATRFVFLSGDVHYGFDVAGTWHRGSSDKTIELVQLTTSATKNRMARWKERLMSTILRTDTEVFVRYGRNDRALEPTEWMRTSQGDYPRNDRATSVLRFRYFRPTHSTYHVIVGNNIGDVRVVFSDGVHRIEHTLYSETARNSSTATDRSWVWWWNVDTQIALGLRPQPYVPPVSSDGGMPPGGMPDPANADLPDPMDAGVP